jgi:hypothetical protein
LRPSERVWSNCVLSAIGPGPARRLIPVPAQIGRRPARTKAEVSAGFPVRLFSESSSGKDLSPRDVPLFPVGADWSHPPFIAPRWDHRSLDVEYLSPTRLIVSNQMAQPDSMDFVEEWRAFLRKNRDARVIVSDAMERTGFAEDEVLFLLMEAWADQNLSPISSAH